MKICLNFVLVINLLLTSVLLPAQTSTIPWTGTGTNTYTNPLGNNVGIGTTTPGAKLSFNDMTSTSPAALPDGITWYNPTPLNYGIYRTAGAWVTPNYQQLQVNWITGIILNPGVTYAKSYVDVQGGGLRVSSGALLCTGTSGVTPATGNGTRMMWIPAKAAFRAGVAGPGFLGITNSWDDLNIGIGSAAFGNSSVVKGDYSFGTGSMNLVEGLNSFVAGNVSWAYGDMSAAFGTYSSATSYSSFVVGQHNYYDGLSSKTTWVLTDPLFIVGNGLSSSSRSNAFTVLKNGNVGVGVISPTVKLDVNGQIKISGGAPGVGKVLTSDAVGTASWANIDVGWSLTGNAGTNAGTDFIGTTDAVDLVFKRQNIEGMRMKSGGDVLFSANVGIGTNAVAGYKLVVCGAIRAKKLIVETGWCDFVFANDYELMSISEVKEYIKNNKHLPNIPTAAEIESNGGDLGELVRLQMQKIEELTLYVIQLKDENEKIREAILKSK